MIEFPIDPTPFVIPYIVIVFLFPWMIYGSYIIRGLILLSKNGLLSFQIDIEKQTLAREFMKTNPKSIYLVKQAKRWMKYVAAFWIGGFIILGGTLYFMETNNMLINHSKGLYGPNETMQ